MFILFGVVEFSKSLNALSLLAVVVVVVVNCGITTYFSGYIHTYTLLTYIVLLLNVYYYVTTFPFYNAEYLVLVITLDFAVCKLCLPVVVRVMFNILL